MRKNKIISAIATLVLLLMIPVGGFAATGAWKPEEEAKKIISGDSVCAGYTGVFTERIVGCVEAAIKNASHAYLTEVYAYFEDTIYLAVTVALVFYGALLATGAIRRPAQYSIFFALKLGFIAFFINHFPEFYFDIMEAMEDLADKVAAYTQVSSTIGCDVNANIWARADCALGAIIGFSSSTALVTGLMGFFMTAMHNETIGKLIFIMGIGFIFTLVMSVARAVYVFIMAYVALAFMVAISPIFICLMIFRFSMDYFLRWVKLCTSFFLQPLILFAYLSMMLAAFDTIVITGEYSLFNALLPNGGSKTEIGTELINSGAYVEKDWTPVRVDFDPSEVGTSSEVTETGMFGPMARSVYQKVKEKWTGEQVVELDKTDKTFAISIPLNELDVEHLAKGFTPPKDAKQYMMGITISLLFCLLFGYIMNALLKYIPILGNELTGGYFDSPNLARGGMPFESKLSGMLKAGAAKALAK